MPPEKAQGIVANYATYLPATPSPTSASGAQHKKCIWLKVKSEMLSLTILVHVLEIFSRFLVLPFKCEAYKEARKLIHSGISELLAGSVGQ